MLEGLNFESLGFFVAFIWPGVLAQQVYRLVMPTRAFEWKEAVGQGLFYSILNYIILFLPALFLLNEKNLETHPVWYWAALVLLLILGPAALAVGYKSLHKLKWLGKWVQAPYQTSWDYFFDQRIACFIRVHLKDGRMIGGYWGKGSYASAYPHEGDLYISRAVQVAADGTLTGAVEGSRGILIRKEEYSFLEFLNPPAYPTTSPYEHGQGRNADAAPAQVGADRERRLPTVERGVSAGESTRVPVERPGPGSIAADAYRRDSGES